MRTRLCLALLSLAALSGCLSSLGDRDGLTTDHFAEFESWHKVNAEPLIGPADGLLRGKHLERDGVREVYANDIAREVFEGRADLPFPEGSIVVKDTFYLTDEGGIGERWNITVMKKREAGYDPDNGDWEYATAGPRKDIRVRGRWNLCIDCHLDALSTDYVFTWE